MRTLATATSVTVAAFLLLPGPLLAQEETPEGQKRENADYYEIVRIDYEPGKRDTALDIIRNHYIPAVQETGYAGPAMTLVHQTGPWDLTLVWELTRGPSAFAWEVTPEGAAFQQQFVEMVGEEKAQEIAERYQSYIARSTVTLSYQPSNLMAEER